MKASETLVKVYDRVDSMKSTDVVDLAGILTMEPYVTPKRPFGLLFNSFRSMTAELESPNVLPVPTLHVLFSRPLPLTISPRIFPYSSDGSTFQTLRDQLISWIADEGLAGDKDAAEWVLLSIIAKVYVVVLCTSMKPHRVLANQGHLPSSLHP
jgi:hypothetical protein